MFILETSLGIFFFTLLLLLSLFQCLILQSISGENSDLERVISCSWETGLDLRGTSVQSMSFPKSTCSPGARHPDSFSAFQTDSSWDRDNKSHISKGDSNLHNLTETNPQILKFSSFLSTFPLSHSTGVLLNFF